ncbi:MAG: sigma-70 family RNA polymerase sigma factor [Bacilli bacterium]|nr:sigma-70 family RNA polymerase sigma factor [Bacilli bacterium]
MDEITEIILKNETFIYSIAKKFSKYKNKEDLFQVGCIGMIEAYKNFDETKGTKFTTYAYNYVYGQMSKYVREDHIIKLNRELNTIKSKIEKAKEHLSQCLMREPTNKEISDFLEIDEDTIGKILNYKDPYSMEENYADELSMYEIISDKEKDYNTLIALKMEIEKLNEPEKTIMIKRYYEDLTQTEIAKKLGLSQVDISRKENKILTKLRKTFN